MEEKRIFTILDYPSKGETLGKFKSVYPSGAAHKAFHRLSKDINFIDNQDGTKYLVFYIQDINSKKIYPYIGTIIILENPLNVNYKNKTVKVKHRLLVAQYDKDMEEVFKKKI